MPVIRVIRAALIRSHDGNLEGHRGEDSLKGFGLRRTRGDGVGGSVLAGQERRAMFSVVAFGDKAIRLHPSPRLSW